MKKGDVVKVTSEFGLVWKGILVQETKICTEEIVFQARTFSGSVQTIKDTDKVEVLTGIDAAYPGCKVRWKSQCQVFVVQAVYLDMMMCNGSCYYLDKSFELYTEPLKPTWHDVTEEEFPKVWNTECWFWDEHSGSANKLVLSGYETRCGKNYRARNYGWYLHCSQTKPE